MSKLQGIITASDSRFFPGLYCLIHSLKTSPYPLLVYDLGLTDAQRKWCSQQSLILSPHPPLVVPKTIYWWQTWNKPWYIQAAPFKKVLWLDADAFVVGDLQPLFDQIDRESFAVLHTYRSEIKGLREWIYRKYPVPNQFPPGIYLNAGVLGFNLTKRDHLLSTWQRFIKKALRSPRFLRSMPWADETALNWAVQKEDRFDFVVYHEGWNHMFTTQATNVTSFMEALRAKAKPDDIVIHVCGTKKPWDFFETPLPID